MYIKLSDTKNFSNQCISSYHRPDNLKPESILYGSYAILPLEQAKLYSRIHPDNTQIGRFPLAPKLYPVQTVQAYKDGKASPNRKYLPSFVVTFESYEDIHAQWATTHRTTNLHKKTLKKNNSSTHHYKHQILQTRKSFFVSGVCMIHIFVVKLWEKCASLYIGTKVLGTLLNQVQLSVKGIVDDQQ